MQREPGKRLGAARHLDLLIRSVMNIKFLQMIAIARTYDTFNTSLLDRNSSERDLNALAFSRNCAARTYGKRPSLNVSPLANFSVAKRKSRQCSRKKHIDARRWFPSVKA